MISHMNPYIKQPIEKFKISLSVDKLTYLDWKERLEFKGIKVSTYINAMILRELNDMKTKLK